MYVVVLFFLMGRKEYINIYCKNFSIFIYDKYFKNPAVFAAAGLALSRFEKLALGRT